MKACLNLTLNKLYQQFSLSGSLKSLNTYSTYNAEDNKLKILAVEVLTHLQDPSAI